MGFAGMLLTWLVGAVLVLPGYALVRRLFPDDLKCGLLGVVGLSYIATFAILSPVSIFCYVIHLPVAVLSTTMVLAVVVALVTLTRDRAWEDARKLLVGGLCFELALVAVDVLIGSRVGGYLQAGDCRLHLARIRFLLDHGFSNQDPFIAGGYFFPIYHTNIWHAVQAAWCQLTFQDHWGTWAGSLAWCKVVCLSGVYFLTWSVFQRRWVAWVAVVYLLACIGPVTFLVYPNKLAPYWLSPFAVGFAIQAIRGPLDLRTPVKLAVVMLLLGQMHGLYAVYTVMAIGPLLVGVWAWRVWRKHDQRWRLGLCLLGLAAALPFPIVSRATSEMRSELITKRSAQDIARRGFVHFDNGWVMFDPAMRIGRQGGIRYLVLACGLGLGLVGDQRRFVLSMLGVTAAGAAVLYLPPLCTLAIKVGFAPWMLSRISFVMMMGFAVLVPASAAYLLETKLPHWSLRGVVSVGAFVLAIVATAGQHGFDWRYLVENKPTSWPAYLSNAGKSAEERTHVIKSLRAWRRVYADHLPHGATILADQHYGVGLVMSHDCRIVASGTGSAGVADIWQRRKDVERMCANQTPWEERRALLKKYDVSHYFAAGVPRAWTRGHAHLVYGGPNIALFRLDLSG